jgi:hypothetical protein
MPAMTVHAAGITPEAEHPVDVSRNQSDRNFAALCYFQAYTPVSHLADLTTQPL